MPQSEGMVEAAEIALDKLVDGKIFVRKCGEQVCYE